MLWKVLLHFFFCKQNDLLSNRTYTAWKVPKYGVFSGLYFPAFRLNTERYSVSLRIQSKCRKMRTRRNSLFGHFSHSVILMFRTILPSSAMLSRKLSYIMLTKFEQSWPGISNNQLSIKNQSEQNVNYLCIVSPWLTDNFYEENNLYNAM